MKNLNPRLPSLKALSVFTLPLFGLGTLLGLLNYVVVTLLGWFKSGFNLVNPRNMFLIFAKPFFKIALFTHLIFLAAGFEFGRRVYFDPSPIIWFVKARIQGIDTSNCLNLPPEVWTRIDKCRE